MRRDAVSPGPASTRSRLLPIGRAIRPPVLVRLGALHETAEPQQLQPFRVREVLVARCTAALHAVDVVMQSAVEDVIAAELRPPLRIASPPLRQVLHFAGAAR